MTKWQKISRRELLQMMAAGGATLILSACSNQPDEVTSTNSNPSNNNNEANTNNVNNSNNPATNSNNAVVAATAVPAIEPTATPTPYQPPTSIRITPNEDFYTMKYHPSPPPEADLSTYRLEIVGEVDNPLSLTLDDLKAFPSVTEMRTLQCISNPVGGNLIGNAVWTGVQLSVLLEEAGIRSSGRELKLESLDGYHTGIPTNLARHKRSLLVYEMNGEPLPAKHGYPLRCLWPGRYGQKQPKWIQTITAQRTPHTGHFEGQGWTDDAFILPNSQIEVPPGRELQPADFYIAGRAYSGESGIEKIEISLTDGDSWQDAQILRGDSSLVWTQWWIRVQNAENGTFRVLARVTDNTGRSQSPPERNSSLLDGTFPEGTDVMHRVVVQVKV